MDNRGNGRQGQPWVPACSSADFPANEISLDRKGTVRNFREKVRQYTDSLPLITTMI